LHTHDAQKLGVDDKGEGRKSELRADEVRQHLIQIVEHVLQKLPLGARLDRGEQEVAETAPIFQKENREQRHNKQQPRLFRDIGYAHTDPLCQGCDVILVADQKRPHRLSGVVTPVMLLLELVRDLAELTFSSRPGNAWPKRAASRVTLGPTITKNTTTSASRSVYSTAMARPRPLSNFSRLFTRGLMR
jgi:hypothetical protein